MSQKYDEETIAAVNEWYLLMALNPEFHAQEVARLAKTDPEAAERLRTSSLVLDPDGLGLPDDKPIAPPPVLMPASYKETPVKDFLTKAAWGAAGLAVIIALYALPFWSSSSPSKPSVVAKAGVFHSENHVLNTNEKFILVETTHGNSLSTRCAIYTNAQTNTSNMQCGFDVISSVPRSKQPQDDPLGLLNKQETPSGSGPAK